LVESHSTYSPFRPGMTATVDIITKTKKNILAVPISSVVKSDTASTKEIKMVPTEDEKKALKSDKKFECVL
jgi:HlyD family secretion protein